MSNNENDNQLAGFRQQIDDIDLQILELLNRRIQAAQQIGVIKTSLNEPAFYRPEREAQVIRRLLSNNSGPAGDQEVEHLFREIMSIARGAEAQLSVSVLGPLGTYSEAAARQHFGAAVDVRPFATMDEVFRDAENDQSNFAVVPVENSTEGGVGGTLDRLMTSSLIACGEVNLEIHHNLLSQAADLSAIKQVLAHSQALGQCKRWLDRNLPGVPLVPVSSNADAAVAAQQDPTLAAIAGRSAADRYELTVHVENIEDEPGNTTRFMVLSKRKTPASGDDKTSLLLSTRNTPGALFTLLKPLLENGIDMTRIESRPSKLGLWEYVFYIDVIGHIDNEKVAKALQELRSEAGYFRHLGSYPRAI